MKQINLTKGEFCIVDDEDYLTLKTMGKWHFSSPGYAARRDGKIVYMHRLIMSAKKGEYVDHINGEKLDNRRCNLRICTNAQNAMNSKIRSDNKTGFRGVYFDSKNKKFNAQVSINKKTTRIGVFNTAIDAAKAYNEAAIKCYGEFANLNNVPL